MDVSEAKFNALISEIADQNDFGMDAYIHRKSLKSILLPNSYHHDLDHFEYFLEEEYREIDQHFMDYIKVGSPSAPESFEMMMHFTENMEEGPLKNKAINSLNRKKRFAHFKQFIHSSELREMWFDFKKETLETRAKVVLKHELG